MGDTACEHDWVEQHRNGTRYHCKKCGRPPKTREEKDRAMACNIVEHASQFARGKVVGIAGNDLEHSKRICALALEVAAASGVDMSHVTLKPLDTLRLNSPTAVDKH